jgi:hypothetical protein
MVGDVCLGRCCPARRGVTIRQMSTEHIIALLISERDKLNRAIEALGTPVKRRGRPPKNPLAVLVTTAVGRPAPKKLPGLSPAKRKAQSERMKAYWAKRKKQAAKD